MGLVKRKTHAQCVGLSLDTDMNFKEWLLNEECGTMGCPGHPFGSKLTPTGRASEMYPKYKKDNSGCSGTSKPCASGDSGGGGGSPSPAPAAGPAPSKMRKK